MPQRDDTEYEGNPEHWLEKGASILTPERAKMLDDGSGIVEHRPDGRIGFAQVRVLNVMNFLYDADLLTDDEWASGLTFELWRDVARTAMGAVKGAFAFSAAGGRGEGRGMREYGYILILRRMHPSNMGVVHAALDTIASTFHKDLARRQAKYYQRAFGSLNDLMPKIYGEIDAVKERLENCSDDELFATLRALQRGSL